MTRSRPGSRTLGKGDKLARSKATVAADRTEEGNRQLEDAWPVGSAGTPMMKAEISASELIPTGQYANVSIGPARIQFLIDPDRELGADEAYFTEQERDTIAQALNEAAEIIEADVIAVQRNLVLESIQEQASENGDKQ